MLQSQSYESITSISNISGDPIRVEYSTDISSVSEEENESFWVKIVNFCLRRR